MPFITDERNTDPANAMVTHWWKQHAETLKNVPRPGTPERAAIRAPAAGRQDDLNTPTQV